MTNQHTSLKDDEIDFGKLSSKLWAAFIYPIKLLIQNFVTTLLFLVAAVILSISLKYLIPKRYKSSFIIRPIEKNERLHIRILGDLQLLSINDDFNSLSRELKLDESVVSTIRKISVTNYYYAKNKPDSANVTAVDLVVKDYHHLSTIQNAILQYLEENPYFKKLKELNLKSIALKSKLINDDILLLDSLKKLQLSSYDKLKITEQNSVLLKDVINPTSTYTLSLERMNQKTGLLFQSEFINNFLLVKPVIVTDVHAWPPRILIMCAILCPLFLIICSIYLHFKKVKAPQP